MNEHDERIVITRELVELVAGLLAARWTKGRIKQVIYEINGDEKGPKKCARGTVERLLKRARAHLRTRLLKTTLDDQKAMGIGFLESVIADDSMDMRHRLNAQEKLNDLLGLSAKYRREADHFPPLDDEEDRLRKMLERMDDSMGSGEVVVELPTDRPGLNGSRNRNETA